MSELRRITERYLLEKQVATGEGVTLFRGTDIESGATVAVELIHGDDGGVAEWRQQFLETARALRSLDHPSLPRVLDFGITHAGGAFLVTEYVDGFHPSYQEIREALRLVLFGDPGSLPPARPEPEMLSSPVVALPTPPPRMDTPPRPPNQRRLLLGIGVPVAAILLVGIVFGLFLLRLENPAPLPEPPPSRAVAVRPAAPPPPVAPPSPPATPAPAPVLLAASPRAGTETPSKRVRPARKARPRSDRAARGDRASRVTRAELVARLDRAAAERKADQDLEDLLRTVGWYETLNQPLEGLRLLSEARPDPRYAQRLQDTRRRLETQFVQLDQHPPGLVLGVAGVPLYERGKAGTVHLRIADDFGVKTMEGWARSPGGPFVRVAIHHLFGVGYSLDVPPEVHRNQTEVEFYVTASDLSGHSGQLGSPERPLKMMRKSWLEKLLGMNQRSVG